jgi:hypothetical protein
LKPEFWTEVALREAPWAPLREEGNDSCVDVLWLDTKVLSGVWYFFVHRPDLEKLFGPLSDQPSASEAEPAPLKSTRGAKPAYDFEKILIAAAVIVIRDGVPESANELVAQVLENYSWPNGEPAKSELNKHINPLYFAAKAALK